VLHPKKVGTLPVEGSDKEKQTNEIKMAIPLLEAIEIRGKTISADALLTQRKLARYLVEERGAHYHFTIKGNQKNLLEDTIFYFQQLDRPSDFTSTDGEHGRIETRKIWVTPPSLTTTWTSPMWGKHLWLNALLFIKKVAKKGGILPMESQVKHLTWRMPGKYYKITEDIGLLKIAATTS